jgi:hypothetical protein
MGEYEAIERFLSTGEYDARFEDFAGDEATRHARGTEAMRDVLLRVVAWKAKNAPLRQPALPADVAERITTRIRPMLCGLFVEEGELVCAALRTRIVVLTARGFGEVVRSVPLRTAWELANLLLDDLGAPPLADDVPALDGMCVAGRAWLLPGEILADPGYPDVVVHEVAHLTHHLRRSDLGLPGKGPLLHIPASRREGFAYACERFNALLLDPKADLPPPSDARVDRGVLDALLTQAMRAPEEGWTTLRHWAEHGTME